MQDYRFHLQKYRMGSKTTCPKCGHKRCFAHYVDEEQEIQFPDNVGLCDHVNSCGYDYTPKDFFRDNPTETERLAKPLESRQWSSPPQRQAVPQEPSYISADIVEKSLGHYDINPLFRYLCSVLGKPQTERLFEIYKVGTSKKWNGATVYWQTDINGRVRTGKVMSYDAKTGHRIKEPRAYVSWAHREIRLPDFNLRQCFFGEHLLAEHPSHHVMIVESEKTAIIAAHFMPQYIWLATGGMNGCFNRDTVEVLRGREVTLMPDLGATERWKEKLPMLSSVCKSVSVSDMLERIATDEQRSHGLDIADFLLMQETKQMILAKMIQRNPSIQLLIDKLQLELVEDE